MFKLIRSQLDLAARVQIMGVLNITPDSFSDGGQFNELDRAVARAMQIEAEGADILDIGGESTRPGSLPISVDEEIERVLPVIEGLQGQLKIPISIDTTKAQVARRAVAAGAEMINDISGLRFDPELAEIAAATGAGLVLMHSRGTPETMQRLAPVEDIFAEVIETLRAAVGEAINGGVSRGKIILDPGIGFGKTREQNLQLIYGLDRIIDAFTLPLMLGTSRKSFIIRTLDQTMNAKSRDENLERRAGTAASIAIGIERGARIIRVHDVGEMAAVAKISEAILASS